MKASEARQLSPGAKVLVGKTEGTFSHLTRVARTPGLVAVVDVPGEADPWHVPVSSVRLP